MPNSDREYVFRKMISYDQNRGTFGSLIVSLLLGYQEEKAPRTGRRLDDQARTMMKMKEVFLALMVHLDCVIPLVAPELVLSSEAIDPKTGSLHGTVDTWLLTRLT